MAAKLHKLESDARFAPLKCLQRLVDNINDGKCTPRRIVIVVDAEEDEELHVFAAGPGMDYVPTSVGLLYQAMHTLAEMTRNAE